MPRHAVDVDRDDRDVRPGGAAPRVGSLKVWETDDTVFVGWTGAEDDWLAAFSKHGEFPARAWAERMADLFNKGDGDAPYSGA